jgi:hypothetical protein
MKNIAKKLAEFQKLSQKVVRDSKNPHYRSKYASLDAVLDAIRAPLLEAGLIAIQRVDEDFLITNIMDLDSPESIDSRIKLIGATDMQKLGSALTYARRYSLLTLLGLGQEDDDGNLEASIPAKTIAEEIVDAAPRAIPAIPAIPAKNLDEEIPMVFASDLIRRLPTGSEERANAYLQKLKWIKPGQTLRDLDPEKAEKIAEKFDNFLSAAGIK